MSDGESSGRQIASRSRPIRVAYVVELNEDSHPILDAIFHSSKQYWGGRFSLIVPAENGVMRDAYRAWMRLYDPDIIYSYVDLSPETRLDIQEQIYPAYLVRHRTWGDEDGKNAHRFRPALPLEPLRTSTVIPILSRRSDFGGERTIRVVSGAGTLGDSPFFRDNFGMELGGLENDLNGRLSEFGSISLVDEREPDPRLIRSRSERVFTSIEELLGQTGRDRRTTTPMRLAAALAPRLEIRDRRWSHSFNLIVGDTITDRIVYWNSRFAYPVWRDGEQVDLRVPTALVENGPFAKSLGQFLKELPPVSGDNSGGTPIVTVRSSSLDAQRLEAIKSALAQPKSWVHYEVDTFASVDDCVPSLDRRPRLAGNLTLMHGLPTGRWGRAPAIGNSPVPQADPPEHLRHCPVTLQSIHEGLWAVDLDIDRTVNYSPHSNTTDTWRLPRRLRVTGAFTGPYQVGLSNGESVMARTALGGFLTLFTGARGSLPAVSEPSDERAVTHALMAGRDWWPFVYGEKPPPQLCCLAERSNAGRYFFGSLELLGGLHRANSFLLHRFWREQLARFGATDQRPEQRLSDIETRLKRRLPSSTFNLKDEKSIARLSNIVLQEADAIRLTTPSVTWTQLKDGHERFIQLDWEAHPPADDVDVDEWKAWDRESLRHAVQSLCVSGVLHQGVEHTCPRCHHIAWVTIGALDKEIQCDICGRPEPAPVNEPWDFRLNGFLRDALRSHGVGPLFWALDRIRKSDASSFWFEGPLNIFLTKEDYQRHQPNTDIDLTVVADGTVRMCEVKQSARNLGEVEAFANLMKQLRPDIATIAVMEPSTRAIKAQFAKFAAALEGTGIEPELITFEPERDLREHSYLGPMRSLRMSFVS